MPYVGGLQLCSPLFSYSSVTCIARESLFGGHNGERMEAEIWFWQLLVPVILGVGQGLVETNSLHRGCFWSSQFLECCAIVAQHQPLGKHLGRQLSAIDPRISFPNRCLCLKEIWAPDRTVGESKESRQEVNSIFGLAGKGYKGLALDTIDSGSAWQQRKLGWWW